MACPATIRSAERRDRIALAGLHAEAWRYAYRGIIPGLALERMIARRSPASWAAKNGTLVLEFDGSIVGYATACACRIAGGRGMGEISELYVKPECHGAGFGRALFAAARARLAARGLRGLLVWALADNELACAFYAAMGGTACFRTVETLGGVRLAKIGYHWS